MTGTIEISILLLVAIILFVILIGVVIFIFFNKWVQMKNKITDLERANQQLEHRVYPLELETIKYKLNPHLFKNVLNSIQSHAYQTYYSLEKLANVLDYVLYESDQQMVSLKEELDFVMNLIEINRIKVSPLFDLRVKNKINSESKWFEEKIVAPLITVDLIENAFKHSDLQNADSFISVVFEIVNDVFILTVTNKVSPAPPLKKEKGGVGTQNFKKRMDIIYKNNYKLTQSSKEGIFTAQLKINLNGHLSEMYSS